MPDVKYIFRAEDRTRGPIDRIRRRINSIGGRGANIRIGVQATGLDRIKSELDSLRASSVRVDVIAGDESGLTPLRDIPDRREVVIDYILGSTAGSEPFRDLPEAASVRVDYELGSSAGVQDIPDVISTRVDYELGSTVGVQDMPESATVRVDYELGSTAGVQDIPEAATIRVDYELGSTAGVQDMPDVDTVRVDYELGSTAGVQDVPDVDVVRVDYELGSTAGVQDIPEAATVRVDYELGSTAGVQEIPEVATVRVDYELGSTAGVQDIPEAATVRVDYELGSTAGVQDIPEVATVRVDYELGSTAGVQDIPEAATVRVDYELGSTAGVQEIPEAAAIRVDYTAGSEAGLDAWLDMPESAAIRVDYVLGDTAGTAQEIPESAEVRIDYALGSEAGLEPLRGLPESAEIRVDYVLGSTAGAQEVPEAVTIRVDYEAGSTSGLQPSAPAAASGGGGGGPGIDLAGAATGVGAGYMALQAFQAAGQTIESWQNLEQAVADTERLYFANTGQRFTDSQRRDLVKTGQGISATSDVSTREGIGAVFMGLQQGRSFEAMTGGGLAQTLINTSMGAKGLGMGTLEALPYVISSVTDIMDALVGVDPAEAQDRASRMMISYVGGGKGDVTNFARVMGDVSPIARMLGWTPEQALGTTLTGMPGFARPGMASTGTRNMLRDLVQGQGKEGLYDYYQAAGWVAPGTEEYDDKGKLTGYQTRFFDQDTGLMKSPEQFFELLQELNNADIVDPSQVPSIMSKLFTIEAMAAADFIRISDAQQKYEQVQQTLANADIDAMREIYIQTLGGQDEVLAGRWEDAFWQMGEMLGMPELKGMYQESQGAALDDIQEMYDFDQINQALAEAATPERFGFFQERGLARPVSRQAGPARPESYQVAGLGVIWRTPEKLEELNQLLAEAIAYQRPLAPVGADIQEIAAGLDAGTGGTHTRSPMPLPGGRGGGSHTVARGDTLSAIAAAQGMSLDEIIAANPQIADPNLIEPGQRINLPGGGAAKPAVQPYSPTLSPDIQEIADPADPYSVPQMPLPGGRDVVGSEPRDPALSERDMYGSDFASGVSDFSTAVQAFSAAVGLPPPLKDEIAPPTYGYGDSMPPGQQRAMYGGPAGGPEPTPLPGGRQPASYVTPDAAQGIAAFTEILTGLLPTGGLGLDTTDLDDIGVKAKVTQLDTTEVENQVIKLAADVIVNVQGGQVGTAQRVRQDTSTQRNQSVSAATYDAGRQRSGGGGGSVGENFFR